MQDETNFELAQGAILALTAVGVLGLLFFGLVAYLDNLPELPKDCSRFRTMLVDDCRWCEDRGGRYYGGGFGASQCVFPPAM